jgi:hypothetical protein
MKLFEKPANLPDVVHAIYFVENLEDDDKERAYAQLWGKPLLQVNKLDENEHLFHCNASFLGNALTEE